MTSSDTQKVVHIHHGKENYKTVMTAGRHELLADEPLDQAGMDTGPDPYDYLLMSLGACTAITLKMYADRKRWPVEDIFVEMKHSRVLASGAISASGTTAASGTTSASGTTATSGMISASGTTAKSGTTSASDGNPVRSGTQKIDRIEKEIIVKGDLDDKQLERLLQISHKCPVNKTLQGTSIEMHAQIRRF